MINKIIDSVRHYVKDDDAIIATVTYVYLSRFTKEPLNLFLKGESTIGKSYVTRNTLKILGEDRDVWFLGGLSPTALVHDYGVLKDENGYEINLLDAPSKRKLKMENPDASPEERRRLFREEQQSWLEKLRNSYYEVNLEGKLLVFLEPPHIETFNKLRPILSHDAPQISYKFTDKTKSGQLRTSHVVIKGWPATIFCTSEVRFLKDLSTRSLTATPNLSENKIKAAVTLSSDFSAYGEDLLEPDPEKLQEINGLITKIKVKAPKTVLTPLCHEVQRKIKYWGKRVMRDWPHFLTLVKMNALLNFENRPKVYVNDSPRLLATVEDYVTVLKFWQQIEETTVTGVSGSALEVFNNLIKPLGPVTNYAQLTEKSKQLYSEPLSSSVLRDYVRVLRVVGLVDTEPDPEDKRRKLIKVIGSERRMLEIVSKNVYSQFKAIFTLEKLKEWQKQLKQLCLKKQFSLKMFLQDENVEDIEKIYMKHFNIKQEFLDTIFFTQNTVVSKKESRKNEEKSNRQIKTDFTQLNRITGSLYPTEKCSLCGGQPVEWQVNYPDGSWALVCDGCASKLRKNMEVG